MGWRHEYLPEHAKRVKDKDALNDARLEWCEFGMGCVCKSEQIHVHHVKSRGAGGGDVAHNLVSLCWVCHQKAHEARISRERMLRFVELRNRLRAAVGTNCKCGCARFIYLEAEGAFRCHRCSQSYRPK